MPKGKRKKQRKVDPVARFLRPTEAREAHNDFRSAGAAVRVVPVIETMALAWERDKGRGLSPTHYDALLYYREQAHRAEDDYASGSTLDPERVMGGGGGAPGSTIPAKLLCTPAILETGRIERDLGSLLPIARAIAVEDMSLTQWCIQQHGGRERYDGKGRFVAMVPNREREVMKLALMELRYAAGRIVR